MSAATMEAEALRRELQEMRSALRSVGILYNDEPNDEGEEESEWGILLESGLVAPCVTLSDAVLALVHAHDSNRGATEQADTERLDWLDAQWQNPLHIEVDARGDGGVQLRRAVTLWQGAGVFARATVRECIDNATTEAPR